MNVCSDEPYIVDLQTTETIGTNFYKYIPLGSYC